MWDLQPPRHISTLPNSGKYRCNAASDVMGYKQTFRRVPRKVGPTAQNDKVTSLGRPYGLPRCTTNVSPLISTALASSA
jgi:hypothetical protein